MIKDDKGTGTPAKEPAPAMAAGVEAEQLGDLIGGKKKKKKKRKYTRGLRGVQEIGRGMNRASSRIGRAISEGLRNYYKNSDRSARKRRDGMVVDMAFNWPKAIAKAARVGSRAPNDLARRLPRKTLRRVMRSGFRGFFPGSIWR